MKRLKKSGVFIILLLIVSSLIACSGDDDSSGDNDSENQELRIAYDVIPPTLDPHISNPYSVMDFTWPMFETLVTIDSNYEPQMLLAESYDVSDDQKSFTFHLREGIHFHNDKEMTAEDVVASMNRWSQESFIGKANIGDAKFVAEDDYTVSLKLDSSSPLLMTVLGNPQQYPAIMPKEVIEDASPEGVNEYIGTGPFALEEWKEDQYLHLKKYDDYKSLDTESDGLAGKKEALVDEVYLEIVTDDTTRVSGLNTGEYDIATNLPYDKADELESNEDIDVLLKEYSWLGGIFNKKKGAFTDKKARQAVMTGIDMDEILTAAYSSEENYILEHSLAQKDQKIWYNDTAADKYNQKDIEKAKGLLKESDYDGEEVRILVTRDYETHYSAAIILQKELEEIGMNVKLDVYDWSALLERRTDDDLWDMFITSYTFESTPINYMFLHSDNDYTGWTESDEIDSLIDEIKVTNSDEEITELYGELQEETMEYVPFVKFGNFKVMHGTRDNVDGFDVFTNIKLWDVEKK